MGSSNFFAEFQAGEQQKKIKNYDQLNRLCLPGQILFTGSSLMEQFPIAELARRDFPELTIYNRGVGGYTSAQFLDQLPALLLDLRPAVLFLNIGTNDLVEAPDWEERLFENLEMIYRRIRETLPDCQVYIMKFYPVNPYVNEMAARYMLRVRTNENLTRVNERNRRLAAAFGFTYIDANDGLTGEDGLLKPELTVEGVHMYTDGYRIVYRNLRPYLEKAADTLPKQAYKE